MVQSIRRVVTGPGRDGKDTILFDGPAPSVFADQWPGAALTDLWITDETPVDNTVGGDRSLRPFTFAPPPGGTLIRFCEMDPDPPTAVPTMHRTDTLDYQFVLAGELTLLMEDGTETVIGAGEIVVQQGTVHAWANRGTEKVLALVVQIDARPPA